MPGEAPGILGIPGGIPGIPGSRHGYPGMVTAISSETNTSMMSPTLTSL
jgi:hypothetical protein